MSEAVLPVTVDTTLPNGTDTMSPSTSGLEDPIEAWFSSPLATPEEFKQATAESSSPSAFSGYLTSSDGNVRQRVLDYGKKFLGTPYVWGGTTPNGFDCSGFTQYVTKAFGLNIPRLTYGQAGAGQRVAVADLSAGDLVLFNDNDPQGPGHVAFYMGNGQILESPHTGASVRVRSLGKGESVFGVHLKYPGER